MVRQRLTTWGALLVGWCALAAWQYHEYCHEREAAQETLRRQGESVMNALVSGIRSHRRLGQFFEEQVQGVLEELVKSKDVLAAGVASPQGQLLLSSGRVEQLHLAPQVGPENRGSLPAIAWWPISACPPRSPERLGRGGGFGGGRGRGFGARWQAEAGQAGCLSARRAVCRHPPPGSNAGRRALPRAPLGRVVSVAVAGSLLLLCVALVWRMTVRLAAAKAVLEAETRHLRELNQAAAGLAHETRNPLGLIRGWAQRSGPGGLGVCGTAATGPIAGRRVRSRHVPDQPVPHLRPAERAQDRVDRSSESGRGVGGAVGTGLGCQAADTPALGVGERRADGCRSRDVSSGFVQSPPERRPMVAGRRDRRNRSAARAHRRAPRIEVADRGPGVPAEAASRLFSPYFTTRVNGTGLGLAIVRRIAAAHGWEVGYTPRPGGGAIFWVDGIHG